MQQHDCEWAALVLPNEQAEVLNLDKEMKIEHALVTMEVNDSFTTGMRYSSKKWKFLAQTPIALEDGNA